MAAKARFLTVESDCATVRELLVQRPLMANYLSKGGDAACKRARAQHETLITTLSAFGIRIRHFDEMLCETLAFADARDWLLDRHEPVMNSNTEPLAEYREWLDDLPAGELCKLILGETGDAYLRPATSETEGNSRPVPAVCMPRNMVRWLFNGVVLGNGPDAAKQAQAVCLSAVLNFAPEFDHSVFRFWLSSDGAEAGWPSVDGSDLAIAASRTVIGAVTANTAGTALRMLAMKLAEAGVTERFYCIDLRSSHAVSLDDCFTLLDNDLALVDRSVIDNSPAFRIDYDRKSGLPVMESLKSGLAEILTETTGLRLIDRGQSAPGPVHDALLRLDPIVIGPGKLIAFEENEAAFAILEQAGSTIAASCPGSALTRDGRGPRSLVSALRAD